MSECKYKLFDVVRFIDDLPSEGIKAGDIATVLDIYDDGEIEVEISSHTGETAKMLAVNPSCLDKAIVQAGTNLEDS